MPDLLAADLSSFRPTYIFTQLLHQLRKHTCTLTHTCTHAGTHANTHTDLLLCICSSVEQCRSHVKGENYTLSWFTEQCLTCIHRDPLLVTKLVTHTEHALYVGAVLCCHGFVYSVVDQASFNQTNYHNYVLLSHTSTQLMPVGYPLPFSSSAHLSFSEASS